MSLKSFRILFLSFLLLSVSSAYGNAPSCDTGFSSSSVEAYGAVFKETYSKAGTHYWHGQCGRNIKELLLELQRQGLDISGAKVLFLLHEVQQFSGGPILPGGMTPSYSRNYDPVWFFHVILKITDSSTGKAYILDMDGRPVPLPIEEYFSRMFPNKGNQDRLEKIALREIDSGSYLKAFEEYRKNRDQSRSYDENDGVVAYFRPLDLPNYPVMSVRKYLNSQR